MKIVESWLKQWFKLPLSIEKIAEQLTSAGLEVADITYFGNNFSNVVVGEVISTEPHPDAEKLKICQVNVGNETLSIVCGASNVRPNLKVPVALCGAVLPNDIKIKRSKLRGVESFGMLCSAKELQLPDNGVNGLLELSNDAPIGQNLSEYLQLQDSVVDIELTANRGDCLSILGVTRELQAINRNNVAIDKLSSIYSFLAQTDFPQNSNISIKIAENCACTQYAGCLIKNINNNIPTPAWMVDFLTKAGLRSVNAVVDITNYVMLSLGQPLHAFDKDKIGNKIIVRNALNQETLVTLDDDATFILHEQDTVIADENQVLALAGIIGGLNSSVIGDTTNIFLESASFIAENIRKTSKRLGVSTDASYRFERNVASDLPKLALAWARQLILEIVGGQAYEINIEQAKEGILNNKTINLNYVDVNKLLGTNISHAEMYDILLALNMQVRSVSQDEVVVEVPSYRFDINIFEDLCEEIARIYGYDKLQAKPLHGEFVVRNKSQQQRVSEREIKQYLVTKGYTEVITYSFVDPQLQQLLFPDAKVKVLNNPLATELSVMRPSLWQGLLEVATYNVQRQQQRMRIFEVGMCFRDENQQIPCVAGLILGDFMPLQWHANEQNKRSVDFYDLKDDVVSLLAQFGYNSNHISFRVVDLPSMLHPKTSSAIYLHNKLLGFIGELHPAIKQKLDLKSPIFLFELYLPVMSKRIAPKCKPISKFPTVERDLAIIVDENIPWSMLEQQIKKASSAILTSLNIFDIYRDVNAIGENRKSLALRLYFQNVDHTLTDKEVDENIEKIIQHLTKEFKIVLRGA